LGLFRLVVAVVAVVADVVADDVVADDDVPDDDVPDDVASKSCDASASRKWSGPSTLPNNGVSVQRSTTEIT
jgi:hypothetical protein